MREICYELGSLNDWYIKLCEVHNTSVLLVGLIDEYLSQNKVNVELIDSRIVECETLIRHTMNFYTTWNKFEFNRDLLSRSHDELRKKEPIVLHKLGIEGTLPANLLLFCAAKLISWVEEVIVQIQCATEEEDFDVSLSNEDLISLKELCPVSEEELSSILLRFREEHSLIAMNLFKSQRGSK
jgi:hypothetical protein